MNNLFKKGLLTALSYYAIGGLLALLSYWLWGHQYAHAPGAYHLVPYFTWLGGCIWGFISFLKILRRSRTGFYAGTFLINFFLTVGSLIWLNRENRVSEKELSAISPQVDITTEVKGDTAIIRYYGSVLYIQIGDSVYFDQLSMRYSPDSILNRR